MHYVTTEGGAGPSLDQIILVKGGCGMPPKIII